MEGYQSIQLPAYLHLHKPDVGSLLIQLHHLLNVSGAKNLLFFPAVSAPTVNTGCGPIVVTPPPTVAGFNIEYSFDDGVNWGTNTPPTAENCAWV
jgi:hypothetical protein